MIADGITGPSITGPLQSRLIYHWSLPEQNDNISQFAIKKYQFAGVRVTPVFWGKPTVEAGTRIEAEGLPVPDKSLQSTPFCAAIDSE